MSTNRLKQNITYIDVLAKAKRAQRKALLETADPSLILCLCECISNVLNGNVPLKPNELNKLKRYQAILRKLSTQNIPTKQRKELLVQKGGFIPALLTPILGLASSLLVDAITKR